MSDTVTFYDQKKEYKLTVKKEFVKKCDKPSEFDTYDLNCRYHMFRYLHNPSGPAVIRLKDNYAEYWIDGKNLNVEDPDQADKMRHNSEFNNKLLDSLNV